MDNKKRLVVFSLLTALSSVAFATSHFCIDNDVYKQDGNFAAKISASPVTCSGNPGVNGNGYVYMDSFLKQHRKFNFPAGTTAMYVCVADGNESSPEWFLYNQVFVMHPGDTISLAAGADYFGYQIDMKSDTCY